MKSEKSRKKDGAKGKMKKTNLGNLCVHGITKLFQYNGLRIE